MASSAIWAIELSMAALVPLQARLLCAALTARFVLRTLLAYCRFIFRFYIMRERLSLFRFGLLFNSLRYTGRSSSALPDAPHILPHGGIFSQFEGKMLRQM